MEQEQYLIRKKIKLALTPYQMGWLMAQLHKSVEMREKMRNTYLRTAYDLAAGAMMQNLGDRLLLRAVQFNQRQDGKTHLKITFTLPELALIHHHIIDINDNPYYQELLNRIDKEVKQYSQYLILSS